MLDAMQPYLNFFTTSAMIYLLAYGLISTARQPFARRKPWTLLGSWALITALCPFPVVFTVNGYTLQPGWLVYIATGLLYVLWLGAFVALYILLRYSIIATRIMQITRQVQRQTNGTGKIDWSTAYDLAAVAPLKFWRPVLWKYIESRA